MYLRSERASEEGVAVMVRSLWGLWEENDDDYEDENENEEKK